MLENVVFTVSVYELMYTICLSITHIPRYQWFHWRQAVLFRGDKCCRSFMLVLSPFSDALF